MTNKPAFQIEFSHEAVDAFWRVWQEVGEPHKHGVYESTWMAFRAAMEAGGKDQRASAQTSLNSESKCPNEHECSEQEIDLEPGENCPICHKPAPERLAPGFEAICEFEGGKCDNIATIAVQLGSSEKWYACCDKHASYARRGKTEFRDLNAADAGRASDEDK